MNDSFGRTIDYLRVSITDRCNLRCRYCMPEQGIDQLPRREILTLEEIKTIIRAGIAAGIKKVRLTGGEPLVRKNLVYLIRSVSAFPGLEDLSLTSNGILLADMAQELKAAGLKRVNISLDTLREHEFRELTRGGDLGRVLAGIDQALAAGLTPLKLNVVVQRSFNLSEVRDFVSFTKNAPVNVRFIELMPMGYGKELNKEFVPASEVRELIETDCRLVEEKVAGGGPADYFRIEGYQGTVGFIHAISRHFCGNCNRLRLTADGRLRFCLQQEQSLDIKGPLRQGAAEEELVRLFNEAVQKKPAGYRRRGWNGSSMMSSIGG